MYAELFYLLTVFMGVLLCWLWFVDYKLNYPERIGPKIGSILDLSDFDTIDSLEQHNKKEEQLYLFVSVDCFQCKEMLSRIQRDYLKYQDFVTIAAVGEKSDIAEWKTSQNYDFPIICINFEQLQNEFNITIFPFAVKIKDLKVEEKSISYEQYLEEFETVGLIT
ncbi:MAG: hypothetical protein FWG67_06310 [Defluviitaleaceae bacterium]|nr:hypothetical protein [Defluviitaleaceae bacterium]